jgi:hypothetical protein
MVDPLPAIVKLFAAQLLPSVTIITCPSVGPAGNVNVNGPPLVFAIYRVPFAASVLVVIRVHD